MDRRGMSEHATQRFARKNEFIEVPYSMVQYPLIIVPYTG